MSSNNSKIEWTDKTWNPVTGCTKVSQGCKNCYAERMYERFNGHGSFKNVICHEERLNQPLKWKKPSMIFVNSMSDLFHEDVPFKFIIKVIGVIHDKPTHTFQILTKRARRMYEFFSWLNNSNLAGNFPNMWLGVSVEDQKAADERIPYLLKVPSAVRFLSCEPLLGPIDLDYIPRNDFKDDDTFPEGIDWVIVGGESGPGARPMHPDWIRNLRDQCKHADVPFFFKQWGEYLPIKEGIYERTYVNGHPVLGSNPVEFKRVGKKKAGRLLDGVLHDEFPKKY